MDRATKRAVKAALASTSTLMLAWLFGAFVAWDFNPGNWAADYRFRVAFFGVVMAGFTAVVAGRPQ
jgi:hypothetical protein